jgi:amidophosphoribosyltransferase
MAKEAGANKVYFASAAPAVKYQNLYGIDMPATKELIASKKTDEEVCKVIGADWLIYQDLDDLIESARVGNPEIKEFECSVFTGEYITPVSKDYLENLENTRNDSSKVNRQAAS